MINSIIESISVALNAEFGDGCAIYTESVEQGLNEPCFFVSCMNPASRAFPGKRYFRENGFCIQYLPADGDRAREECNAAAERLYSCLECITVDGDLVRGTKMNYEVAGGALSFFVNYDMFVRKAAPSDPMEEIAQDVAVKG